MRPVELGVEQAPDPVAVPHQCAVQRAAGGVGVVEPERAGRGHYADPVPLPALVVRGLVGGALRAPGGGGVRLGGGGVGLGDLGVRAGLAPPPHHPGQTDQADQAHRRREQRDRGVPPRPPPGAPRRPDGPRPDRPPGRPGARSSASASADAYRLPGSFSRHFRHTVSRSCGVPGWSRRGGTGSCRSASIMVSANDAPWNGTRAVSSSYRITPSAYTSMAGAAAAPSSSLGGHVLRRPHDGAVAGLVEGLGGAPEFELLGDAEVGDLRLAAAGEEHVGGFQVAVDHAESVRGVGRAGERFDHLGRRPRGLRAAGPARQRPAVHELQRDVRGRVRLPRRRLHGAHVEHLNDVRVLELRDGLGLGPEPVAEPRIGQRLAAERLDRDAAVQLAVPGLVDDPHPPSADHREDLVPVDPREHREVRGERRRIDALEVGSGERGRRGRGGVELPGGRGATEVVREDGRAHKNLQPGRRLRILLPKVRHDANKCKRSDCAGRARCRSICITS